MGNVAWAGTVRTDLLMGRRVLRHTCDRCTGCGTCFEICPQGAWVSRQGRAELTRPEACTVCRACLVQCPSGAIEAKSD
jgi:ferredoxin